MLTLGNKLSLNSQPIYKFVNKYSIDFDGVDDYIRISDADSLDEVTTNNFSVSCWVKTTATDGSICVKRDSGAGFELGIGSGKVSWYLNDGSGYADTDDTSTINDGEWHHIVWVFIRNDKAYRYIDGVNSGTNDSITAISGSLANSVDLGIGARLKTTPDNYYTGQIDELALYDRELTQAEITRMYNTYYSPNRVANSNFSQIGNEEVTNGDFSQIGSELVTNGDFATDSDWTFAGTNGEVSGGYGVFPDTTNSYIIQSSVVPASVKQYKLQYEVVESNGGGLGLSGGSSAFGAVNLTSSVGTHTKYITSNGTQTNLQFNNQFSFIGKIDNVSLKEVGQDWTIEDVWTIGDNVANGNGANGSSQELQSNINIPIGTYKITYEIKNYVSGSVAARLGGDLGYNSGNGIYTHTTTTTQITNFKFRGTNFDGSVTNISVKEVGQHWTVANTDADNYVVFNGSTARLKFLNTSPITELGFQNLTLNAGTTYKIIVDVASVTSGSIKIDTSGISEVFNTAGVTTRIVTPTSTTSSVSFYRASADVDITLNSVVIQELKHDATNLMLNAGDYQSANPLITSTKSMEFDGVDDYLTVSDDSSLDFAAGFSVSFWVYPQAADSNDRMICKGVTGTGEWMISFGAGQAVRVYTKDGDDVVKDFTSANTLTLNEWAMVTVVVNRTTNYLQVYKNGGNLSESSASWTSGWSNSAALTMGVNSSLAGDFDGRMTEVGIWNRELTSLEVASLYNQGMPTNLLVNRNNYQSGNPTVFNTKQVDFDGVDDYLETNKSDFLGTSDFTISGWIKPEDITDNYILGQSEDNDNRWYIRINPSSQLQIYSKSGGVEQVAAVASPTIPNNEWLHFVITADRGANTIIYINGIVERTVTNSNTSTLTNTGTLRIGNFQFFGTYFDGDISQIGIWNSTLTADEVSSLYNHGLPIDLTTDQAAYESSSNLVGYWRMGSGTLDTYPLIADQTNATLGSELVTNGDFATDLSGWSGQAGRGSYAWENGKAKITNDDTSSYPNLSQSITTVVGKVYKITATVEIGTATLTEVRAYSNSIIGSQQLTTDGTIEFYITADDTDFTLHLYLFETGNTGHYCYFDNVSVKEVQGNPAIMTNQTSSDIENGSPYANLIQNTNFTDSSEWSVAGWNITNNQAVLTGTGAGNNLYISNILQLNKTYNIVIDAEISAGSFTVMLGGGGDGYSTVGTISSTGTHTITGKNISTTSNTLLLQSQSGSIPNSLKINSVTLAEVNTGLQGYWKMGDGTNDEYPVIYDQVDPTLGSEIIIDTQFNDSNEWNISNAGGTTGWVVSNGQAIMNTDNVSTGRNLLADNSNNLTLGKTYKITIDFAEASGSGLRFGEFGGDFNNWTVIPTGKIGSYTFYRVSQYSGRPVLYALSVNQKINSITVKEVQGNPATMTNMVEGNITNQYPLTKIRNYYRMGDGILDGYPIIQDQTSPNLAHIPTTNLVTYSEDFSQWTTNNFTANSETTSAPNGETVNGYDFGDGFIYIDTANVIIDKTYTSSIYIKANKSATVGLRNGGAGSFTDNTDITLTTDWARYEGISTAGSTRAGRFLLDNRTANGYGVSDLKVFIWHPQLEEQSQPTTYLKSDGIAAVRKSSTTNLIPYSEDFSQWSNARTTNTANQTTSPIETANGTYFEQNTGETNAGSTYIAVTVTSNNHTLSIFAKKKEKDFIVAYDTNANRTYFNISNGTLGTNNSGGSSKIEDYGNGWYRCSVTYSASAGTTNIAWYLGDTDNSTVVTGSGGVYIWGAQLEQQTQAETYAKTTGLPVTIDLFTENNYGTMTNMSASDIVEDTP